MVKPVKPVKPAMSVDVGSGVRSVISIVVAEKLSSYCLSKWRRACL
jgi:hypothetical protein